MYVIKLRNKSYLFPFQLEILRQKLHTGELEQAHRKFLVSGLRMSKIDDQG